MNVLDFLFGDPIIYRGFSGQLFEARLIRDRDRLGSRLRIKGLKSGMILSENITDRIEAEKFFVQIEPMIEEATQ